MMILTGCGKRDSKPVAVVDEVLSPYLKRFENDIGVYTAGINAVFGDTKAPIVGQCTTYSDGRRDIEIDKEFWDQSDDLAREELIYHELGHCAMGLGHDNSSLPDGCPKSIMNEYTLGACYGTHHGEYIADLRSRK